MKKLRYKIIALLLTESEKHLLWRAVDERVKALESEAINSRTADLDNLQGDCNALGEWKTVFKVWWW